MRVPLEPRRMRDRVDGRAQRAPIGSAWAASDAYSRTTGARCRNTAAWNAGSPPRVHRGADDPRERVDETLLQRGAGRSAVGELAARFVDHGRDDDGRIRRVVERRRRHERRQSVTAIDGAQDFVEQGG
jgi:hypothetical protein